MFPAGVLGSSVFAILQAAAMAIVGIVLARQGTIDANTKKVLSNLSMKVTIPCLLFSNLLTCPQGGPSQDPALCPHLDRMLSTAYPFLLLPFLWVSLALLAAWLAMRLSSSPQRLRGLMMSACAFGNSTGLPLVLFSAISTSKLNKDVPSALLQRHLLSMLAVYQVTYPMLQWSLGKWLMTSEDENDETKADTTDPEAGKAGEALGKPLNVSLQEFAGAIFTPPVIAILLALVLGIIDAVRSLLVDIFSYSNDAVLEWAFNAINAFGEAAVPMNMLVLGAGLANVPKLSAIHWPSTIAVILVKMVIYPAVAFGFIAGMIYSGLIAWMVPVVEMRFSLVMVACLVTATPTANNLAVMAEVAAGTEGKQALSAIIFMMYCVAPFSLTAWMTAIVKLSSFAESQG